jgi:aldose 1-epimerase
VSAEIALTTVRLQDEEHGLEATFVPGAGMLCCSLRHRGEELLAQRAGRDAYIARGKTMGIPLLYPWANRLAGFDYRAAGRSVAVPHDPTRVALDGNGLPIHGVIGGRLHWRLTDAAAAGTRSLTATLSWEECGPELFEVFPFRHELRYEALLADGCLEVTLTVHACAEDEVPIAFGLHPYLTLPGVARERWRVELPPMRPLHLDSQGIPVGYRQPQPLRRFELAGLEFDDGFDEVGEPARFELARGRRAISLELLEGFPCAQVYAPAGAQLVCFEPMSAPTNALRSGDGLRVLAPGERHRARFRVCVADLAEDEERPESAPAD